MGSLYDADILLWSEQQADLLRRLARGERVNDAVDWENVIEEVGDVGRSEFNSVASVLEVGLTDLLLAHASPRTEPVGHWRSEAITALAGAARRYSPSMGRRIDLDEIWAVAMAAARNKPASDGGPASPLPENCPFAVEDLVQRLPGLDALLARLAGAGGLPAAG
jgi:Domain of unknown function DUF29